MTDLQALRAAWSDAVDEVVRADSLGDHAAVEVAIRRLLDVERSLHRAIQTARPGAWFNAHYPPRKEVA